MGFSTFSPPASSREVEEQLRHHPYPKALERGEVTVGMTKEDLERYDVTPEGFAYATNMAWMVADAAAIPILQAAAST